MFGVSVGRADQRRLGELCRKSGGVRAPKGLGVHCRAGCGASWRLQVDAAGAAS